MLSCLLLENQLRSCWFAASCRGEEANPAQFSYHQAVPVISSSPSQPCAGLAAAAVLHSVTRSDRTERCCLSFDLPDCPLAHCPNHVAWWCPAYLNKVIHIQPSSLLASSSHHCSCKDVTYVLLLPVQNCCWPVSVERHHLWPRVAFLAWLLSCGVRWCCPMLLSSATTLYYVSHCRRAKGSRGVEKLGVRAAPAE